MGSIHSGLGRSICDAVLAHCPKCVLLPENRVICVFQEEGVFCNSVVCNSCLLSIDTSALDWHRFAGTGVASPPPNADQMGSWDGELEGERQSLFEPALP